jgi:adenosylcobinamide kinase/adenosylcobinamide-phosphate guanylyltransferase
MTHVVRSEFILGGQKSGKSRRAEALAQHWLAEAPQRSALLIATAQAFDDEMRLRIERHRQDRLVRVPGMKTIEEPLALAATIAAFSHPDTLIVVDCLTLWLTAQLMPPNADLVTTPTSCHATHLIEASNSLPLTNSPPITNCLPSTASRISTNPLLSTSWQTLATDLCSAIAQAPGPIVLVGNEIGLGVIPLGQEVRAFVDALGLLNQRVAATCERVTLMSAGLPLTLKGSA